MNLNDLREKRGKIAHELKAIVDAAEAEKRNLTSEEIEKHSKLFDEQDGLRKQIEIAERQQELDREMAKSVAESERKATKAPESAEDLAMKAFRHFLSTNRVAGEGSEELRALQANADVLGGYLVAPELFVTNLIKNVDNMTWIRQNATIFQVSKAEKLGAPSLDADPDDADWTSELATGNEDSAMSFGKRELYPHPLAKRVKISNKLLSVSLMPVEALVQQRLAYKFGISQEKAFLTGSGANQPLGVFTASTTGISTGRDVSTGNTTTSIQFDGLMEAKYSLKGQYWANARWLFHRDALKQISKLKDGEGQYLWQPSVQSGQPDLLLGRPVMMSEYAPNTFTSQQYVGMLADFSHYWIADCMQMQLQVLKELYAESNQTGYIARLETDGMPVLEEAFARVKLA